jgi:alkanesulfonate monooxygenase SsuD/methylene tetrahydromethanopterin reductase-like flavin-dependent oxidoreductase (luciferase family)
VSQARVQFGFCLPAEWRGDTLRPTFVADLGRALDLVNGTFDSAWMVDHLQAGDASLLEGFTTVAFLAGQYPGLRFGNAVLSQSFRNPALLAKMAATLQFLSRGRFVLGLGAGWNAEEYRAYGYDFPSDGVRVEQLDETLTIIRALWTRVTATFQGRHYRVVEARCEPRPDPIPTVMVGAFGPRMLRLTARQADWWNVSSTGPARYGRLAAEFDRACAEIGRDPRSVRRTWVGGCACAPTEAAARTWAGDLYSPASAEDDFGFVGTPEQIVRQMQPFLDMGVDYFILDCGGFPRLTTLELLSREVLPAVNA